MGLVDVQDAIGLQNITIPGNFGVQVVFEVTVFTEADFIAALADIVLGAIACAPGAKAIG